MDRLGDDLTDDHMRLLGWLDQNPAAASLRTAAQALGLAVAEIAPLLH